MAQLGTRDLTLSVGGTDVTGQISNCRIVAGAGDSDFTSFEDAKNGGRREYRMQGTIVQDPATGTFWDKIWTAVGTTVAAVIRPAGGTGAATAAQPTFTGNVIISEPDGDLLGGEANASPTARFTIDIDLAYTAKPIRATA